MSGLHWRFEDEPAPSPPQDSADAAADLRWSPGHEPSAPEQRPRPLRRRLGLALLAAVAVAGVLLAARVASNARLLARIETEVAQAVITEQEALAASDEPVWLALQANGRDAAGRRRFRAGPVGPLPGIAPESGPPATVRVEPELGSAGERGGTVEEAWVETELAMSIVSSVGASAAVRPAGRFVEQSRWLRARDGGWRRAAPDAERLSRWTEPASDAKLPADLLAQLAQLRQRDAKMESPRGLLPQLRTPHLALRFLPADAAVAADLAARLEPWLERRCTLLGTREGPTGRCPRVEITLSLDTPGAAYAVPGTGMRLASPSAGWAPADEAGRAAYAEAVLRLVLRGSPRTPRALEAALLELLLEELGVFGSTAASGGSGSTDTRAELPGPRRLPALDEAPRSGEPRSATADEQSIPDAWTLWRYLRPGIDVLGDSRAITPRQRVAAADAGVTWSRTVAFARHLHAAGGYAATERLTRGLDAAGMRDLMTWLRPALGPAALSVALGWREEPSPWPGPASLVHCGVDVDPLLLWPGSSMPFDLRTAVCPPDSVATDAVIAPDGKAVAVACRGERQGSRDTRILLAPIGSEVVAAGEKLPGIVELVEETPLDCCLWWADDETLMWNVAGVTRGLSRVTWRGVTVRRGGEAGAGPERQLADWSGEGWRLGAPYGGRAPGGALALLKGIDEERPSFAVYDVPPSPSRGPLQARPEGWGEMRWRVDGVQPRWSLDGERVAWLAIDTPADEIDDSASDAAAGGDESGSAATGPSGPTGLAGLAGIDAARIRLAVADGASGQQRRMSQLDRLLEQAGVPLQDQAPGLALAQLAGWSRDGRLGLAVRAAAQEGQDSDVRQPLWLLTWDPEAEIGGAQEVMLETAGAVAPSDRADAFISSGFQPPLALMLEEAVGPELRDAIWRWPVGRAQLDPRVAGFDGMGDASSLPLDGLAGDARVRAALDRPDEAAANRIRAWRYGRDGRWRDVPPSTVGASPAGLWTMDADGLHVVDPETGEVLWRLVGPPCLPDLPEDGDAGA